MFSLAHYRYIGRQYGVYQCETTWDSRWVKAKLLEVKNICSLPVLLHTENKFVSCAETCNRPMFAGGERVTISFDGIV